MATEHDNNNKSTLRRRPRVIATNRRGRVVRAGGTFLSQTTPSVCDWPADELLFVSQTAVLLDASSVPFVLPWQTRHLSLCQVASSDL